jgi:DNA-directed RNA polymerase I and III subunit RPAC1
MVSRSNLKLVFSSDIKWIPQGDQLEKFGENGIKPVLDDILIVKLRPNQVLYIL